MVGATPIGVRNGTLAIHMSKIVRIQRSSILKLHGVLS